MAVIRSGRSPNAASGAIAFDLGDLRREAEALQARAAAEAERIVREARAERERLLAGAQEEGHAAGFESGIAEARRVGTEQGRAEALQSRSQELETLVARWSSALERFEQARGGALDEARSGVLRLACLVAERVTGRVVEIDPDAVRVQLERALERVLEPTKLVIGVHPDDEARAREALPGLLDRIGGGGHAAVVADGSVGAGGCVVRSERGTIDARVESQVAEIVAVLLHDDGPPAEGAS